MTPESVMTMGRHAMEITLMIAAPMLLVALIIGLVVRFSRPPPRSTSRPCPSSPSWSAFSWRWWWPGRGCCRSCSTTCAKCSTASRAGWLNFSLFVYNAEKPEM
jgi:hypothetical protein